MAEANDPVGLAGAGGASYRIVECSKDLLLCNKQKGRLNYASLLTVDRTNERYRRLRRWQIYQMFRA